MDLFERLLGVDQQKRFTSTDPSPIGGGDANFMDGIESGKARVLRPKDALEERNLSSFSDGERQTILRKREVLSTLAYFIGKDFRLPVSLGAPGSGWFWDPQRNAVTIDSRDVLNNPLGFLRFVTSHEGAHRRISRLGEVDSKIINEPGFMMLLNGVEDPRVNNYICDTYSLLEGDMDVALAVSFEQASKSREESIKRMGFRPDSVDATFAIIQNWYNERRGTTTPSPETPVSEKVTAFLDGTNSACQRAYSIYPSKEEADQGEQVIKRYAQTAYRVITEGIWPEFQKLLARDQKEAQASQMVQEVIKEAQANASPSSGASQQSGESSQGQSKATKSDQRGQNSQDDPTGENAPTETKADKGNSAGNDEPQRQSHSDNRGAEGSSSPSQGQESSGTPEQGQQNTSSGGANVQASLSEPIKKHLEDNLSPEAKAEVDEQVNKARKDSQSGQAKMPGEYYAELSDATKEELRQAAEKLPKPTQAEVDQRVIEALSELYAEIAKQLEGKLEGESSHEPSTDQGQLEPGNDRIKGGKGAIRTDFTDSDEFRGFQSQVERVFAQERNVYERERLTVVDIINRLERDLRKIFQERRASHHEDGKRSGLSINVDKRISEVASGISPVDSKAFTRKTKPLEKDYAITILVDLSGSMQHDSRIQETFKSVIVLSEVLKRIGINFEVIGFNDRLYEYKKFPEKMSDQSRDKMGAMLNEVSSPRARYNDDGWALSEASQRLSEERGTVKFLLVLSDGLPEPSNPHATQEYELSRVVRIVRGKGDQYLIGLGLGGGTNHVSSYYPNSVANISTQDLPTKLAELIESAIREPEKFKV